jgi:hypothetical protein
LPCESVTEDAVALVLKSSPTRIMSPAFVFDAKARDSDLALADVVLAACCTKDAAEKMLSVSVAVPVPPPLDALSVTVEVPAAVGVPVINPVAEFTVSPAGSPVAP